MNLALHKRSAFRVVHFFTRWISSLHHLTKRKEFLALQKQGEKIVMPGFVMQYLHLSQLAQHSQKTYNNGNTATSCYIGFTATRKLGNAVIRNRTKRRLRAVSAELFPAHAPQDYAYVIIGRYRLASLDYSALCSQMVQALTQVANYDSQSQANDESTSISRERRYVQAS